MITNQLSYSKNPNEFLKSFKGRCSAQSRESLSHVLSALGAINPSIGDMLLELCVTELEDVATDTERFKGVPQPVTQESLHPYTGIFDFWGILIDYGFENDY